MFVGRKSELASLEAQTIKNSPSFIVIKGRRRIGKSRLASFFASKHTGNKFWDFSGLAPQNGLDDQSQRDHFAQQLATHLNIPSLTFRDWSDAFDHLGLHIDPGDIVLLDEISWMASGDSSFISKLKTWWDKQQRPIMVIVCGSVSTWIEDNILKSTAFFGRINLTLTLEPLPIPDAYHLLRSSGFQGSDYDAYKLLSVLGGIPWYLQQVGSGQTADDVLRDLCFEKDRLLVLEFDRIFHDLFNGRGTTYKKILDVLRDGMKTLSEIRHGIDFAHSGTLSQLMEHLITAGFVTKQVLWSFKTTNSLKQSLYRISDPYMRFYLKLIQPQRNRIDMGGFHNIPISTMPGFEAHLGLQIEQLLLQNRSLLLQAIGLNPVDIVADGPFRQSKTSSRDGCQIDYLVQTVTKNLFVCEFKFKRSELGVDVMLQVEKKIKALKVPKGYATIPVLFHIGGVSSHVATDSYFYRIIDVADFLRPE